MRRPERICAQCGKVERRILGFIPRMFVIWKGAAHDHDFCSFECSGAFVRREAAARRSPAPEPEGGAT